MFTAAITRSPCPAMIDGISTADLGTPVYELACRQHTDYIAALKACGLTVTVLPPDSNYPDSTFVEDTAVLLPGVAVLTRPGADSRRGETLSMLPVLKRFFGTADVIESPGTLEGGDVMQAGTHVYIGLSARTNRAGAEQLISIVAKHGLAGSMIRLEEMLHLKSGVSYLEDGNLLASGELLQKPDWIDMNIVEITPSEAYAANSLWLNGTVLVPAGHPRSAQAIEDRGYKVVPVDVSEFQKLDGGLSCLSLRF